MLSVKGLTSGYGYIEILKEISFEIGEKEIVTLLGSNGAGKTTLMLTLCGIIKAMKGQIIMAGKRIDRMTPEQIVKIGIRLAPEGRRLFPALTVIENLTMGAYTSKDKNKTEENMAAIFNLFPILSQRKKQLAGTLSGGEQQMLSIARAIATSPKLLLLDEPSLGLAPLIIQETFKIIKALNRAGTTILLVEQNANVALKFVDRAYALENGKVIFEGRPEEFLQSDLIQRSYLGL